MFNIVFVIFKLFIYFIDIFEVFILGVKYGFRWGVLVENYIDRGFCFVDYICWWREVESKSIDGFGR